MLTEYGTLTCRLCKSDLGQTILSLGSQPLSNSLPDRTFDSEDFIVKWPLELKICSKCGLGQIGEFASPSEIFSDYTYFSSASTTWLRHSEDFAIDSIKKINLKTSDLVLEIASNDGYLLRFFKDRNINVLGVEPARNVSEYANSIGVETRNVFFGEKTAIDLINEGKIPKLVVCNNVVAHVPDINDFIAGLRVLADNGAIISIEAPSLLQLLKENLFDTIYHEHFSYISVHAMKFAVEKHGLKLCDVESLNTHGGSNRYWISTNDPINTENINNLLDDELKHGIFDPSMHLEFKINANKCIDNFSKWTKENAGNIIGFGAAAKATVLLNACKVQSDEILFVVDNALSKQEKYIPGVQIQIKSPDNLKSYTFAKIIIFPWNIAEEITKEIINIIPNFQGEIWQALPILRRVR